MERPVTLLHTGSILVDPCLTQCRGRQHIDTAQGEISYFLIANYEASKAIRPLFDRIYSLLACLNDLPAASA